MRFYLSSYKIGDYGEKLQEMFTGTNKRIGYISNALNFSKSNITSINAVKKRDAESLQNLEFIPEELDLRNYFCRDQTCLIPTDELKNKLSELSGVFVSGGNTFILRQAFALSGFDTWIQENIASDFVYAGYSAGCCILNPSLKGLQIVDDPEDRPYSQMQKAIWEGLGILNYSFLPHYDSDHGESADIDKEIAYAIENKIPFKAFRDGEVEIFERSKNFSKDFDTVEKELV